MTLITNNTVALPPPCRRLQTNHLGPYTLTRLLEKKLVDGKARVVTVASVTHRYVMHASVCVRVLIYVCVHVHVCQKRRRRY